MKLSLNAESVNALRELAESIPIAVQKIVESTLKVITTYQGVSETLGEHRQSFYDMLLLVKKTQEETVESIQVLPKMLNETADKIDSYITNTPSKTITAKTKGVVDNKDYYHTTNITFSSTGEHNSDVISFGNDYDKVFEWGSKHYSKWLRKLPKEQVAAIKSYSGNHVYHRLNTALRKNEILDNELLTIKENIHAALIKTSIPEDITIYRAMDENGLSEMALYCCQDDLKVGCNFFDSAMMSCSLLSNNGFNRDRSNKYIFRLTAVAGVHAGYIESISLNQGEHEILVDSDHSIYVSGIKECPRSEITNRPEDTDTITVIDGILTV